MFKGEALLLSVLLAVASVSAQRPSPAARTAGEQGVDAARLARLDKVLQQHVDEHRIAGAVALVLRDGRPLYEKAFGWSDKEAGRRMTTDALFRIAS